ncbi:MAG: response regulator [Candidatus Marinimicrobia bacterium]|nr:response regulator [Candidatus Neomarinimicrobiota bacterium]
MNGNIIFVDDDEKLLSGLKRMLYGKKDVWNMFFVKTTDQAYKMLADKAIDVAVLDINMPKKNGFELLGYIKNELESRGIEVVMLTGLKNKDLKRKALNLGATDLINKPVSKEDLIARINSVLRTKKYRDDLIEKKGLLEEQLIQSQKMQIVGILAAGVIHDLKNILSIIRGYPDIIKLRIEHDKPVDRQISNIKKAVNRASQLTLQILDLTRPDTDAKGICDLTDIIKESFSIVQPIFPKTTKFNLEIPDISAKVDANATQITQILLNLFINAKEAISEDNGKIDVKLDKVSYNHESDQDAGQYYQISVTDNGKGMDQETIEKIFKARYTTRKEDGGFGLGLFIINTLVKKHNGYIEVESEPHEGTTFNILLKAINS